MSRYGYGNFKHFRGDDTSIADMVRQAEEQAQKRCAFMARQLVDIIGPEAFDAWVDETFPDHNISWTEAVSYYEAELARYECTCNPRVEPCTGCQNIFAAEMRYAEMEY